MPWKHLMFFLFIFKIILVALIRPSVLMFFCTHSSFEHRWTLSSKTTIFFFSLGNSYCQSEGVDTISSCYIKGNVICRGIALLIKLGFQGISVFIYAISPVPKGSIPFKKFEICNWKTLIKFAFNFIKCTGDVLGGF